MHFPEKSYIHDDKLSNNCSLSPFNCLSVLTKSTAGRGIDLYAVHELQGQPSKDYITITHLSDIFYLNISFFLLFWNFAPFFFGGGVLFIHSCNLLWSFLYQYWWQEFPVMMLFHGEILFNKYVSFVAQFTRNLRLKMLSVDLPTQNNEKIPERIRHQREVTPQWKYIKVYSIFKIKRTSPEPLNRF